MPARLPWLWKTLPTSASLKAEVKGILEHNATSNGRWEGTNSPADIGAGRKQQLVCWKERTADCCPSHQFNFQFNFQSGNSLSEGSQSDILQYRCRQPLSKHDPLFYSKQMEPLTICKYVELQQQMDIAITVKATSLHIHQHYPFLAASPDGILFNASEEGLLEVKCLFSKKRHDSRGGLFRQNVLLQAC